MIIRNKNIHIVQTITLIGIVLMLVILTHYIIS